MSHVQAFEQRYGTALIADAAFRARVELRIPEPGLLPLDESHKLVGEVVTVEARNDLVSILAAVDRAEAGQVVVVANQNGQVGLMGDLIATEAHRRGLAGMIVDGSVRDVADIRRIGLTVVCRGRVPQGPLKLVVEDRGIGDVGVEVAIGGVTVRPGDWAFADADGVLILGAQDLEKTFGWAEQLWRREEKLAEEIRGGVALGEILDVRGFLRKREADPSADFNAHLGEIGRAI